MERRNPNPITEQLENSFLFALTFGPAGLLVYALADRTKVPLAESLYQSTRLLEQFTPLGLAQTLQLGNIASLARPSAIQHSVRITAEDLFGSELRGKAPVKDSLWFQDLMNRAGDQHLDEVLRTGLVLEDGTLKTGRGTTIFNRARVMTTEGAGHIANSIALAHGMELDFNKRSTVLDIEHLPFIVGGENDWDIVKQVGRGIGAESMDRFNRLLDEPLNREPIKSIFEGIEKLTGLHPGSLAVKRGNFTKTTARLFDKFAVGGGMLVGAYALADWAVAQTPIFDDTGLDNGITGGLAVAWQGLNRAAATVWDTIPGYRDFQEEQERDAPGTTSLLKLMGVPLSLATAGAGMTWIQDKQRDAAFLAKHSFENLGDARVILNKMHREAEKHWAEVEAPKRFGRFMNAAGEIPFIGKPTRGAVGFLTGAVIGTALILPFLPGALGTAETDEELQRIYSGQEEVAVRRGRFWESGATPWEGDKIQYFKKHWTVEAQRNARDASVWKDEADTNPISKFIRERFTYDVEEKNYFDRPYPTTGLPFTDIPILGEVLDMTIGQIIKPQLMMHQEEMYDDNGKLIRREAGKQLSAMDIPDPEMTGDLSTQLHRATKRLQEESGFLGFTAASIKEKITGTADWVNAPETFQDASQMYSLRKRWYEQEFGGFLGMNEWTRRLLPNQSKQVPTVNNIRNTMPSWMPKDSPRDWFYGDPYSKITKGEERLAGDGYAEMFPELKGIDPENYPLEYQYKILSDVAPSSDETKALERKLKGMHKRGELENPGLFEEAQRQKAERRESIFYKEIRDANYSRAGQSAAAAAAVKEQLRGDERQSSMRGQYWDVLRDFFVSNPLEVLTPVAPAHKFIGQETATEHYARTQALGTPMPQWSAPIEDFVKPFVNQALDFAGNTAIPAREQHVREIEDYFDMLKYVKARKLEREARYQGDGEMAQRQAQIAKETMIGVDPFGNDYRSFYRALPSDQRDYLQDFMEASTPEEQDRILQLVPENQRRFYEGLWASRYTKALEKASKTNPDLLPDLERMKQLRKTQGFEYDDELVQRWKEESGGRSYSDWYREEVLIPQKMQQYGAPDVNWIGWSPEVDLQQVKTRVVMNEGLNIHDFGLWESNVRKAMYEDHLRNETMPQEAPENIDEARNRLREYLTSAGIRADVRISPVAGNSNRIIFNTQDSA